MPGVYIGYLRVAMGAATNKGLTLRTGQTHMLRYMQPLLERIGKGEIDPSFIISHRLTSLDCGPETHETFRNKKEGGVKVVMEPHG